MPVEITGLDPFDDDQLQAWYDVYLAAHRAEREYHQAYAFEEVRSSLRSNLRSPGAVQRRLPLLARLDGEVVGVAGVTVPLHENTSTVEVEVGVRPDRWRHGIGSALLARVEEIARAERRPLLVGMASYPHDAPADGSGTRAGEFARSQGFRFGLGNVQRVLDLPMPEELVEELLARAAHHHRGYTFRQLSGLAPDDLLPALTGLRGAVETEAPTGGITRERGTVDLDVARAEEQALTDQGRTRYTTVALAPDGSVAGYTDLVVPDFHRPWIYQWGTLVWAAHRGHRLGLALKVRNAAWVQRVVPDRRAIRTWNAEVNAPMVAVNEAMGFRPVDRMGEFQKRLG